jgi:hypothetical protein
MRFPTLSGSHGKSWCLAGYDTFRVYNFFKVASDVAGNFASNSPVFGRKDTYWVCQMTKKKKNPEETGQPRWDVCSSLILDLQWIVKRLVASWRPLEPRM